MPNIWYDVSAVTDVRPLITLFSREDRRWILYGSMSSLNAAEGDVLQRLQTIGVPVRHTGFARLT